MKNFITLLMVSMLGGILTLGSYKLFFEEELPLIETTVEKTSPTALPVSYDSTIFGTNADFTEAAEKTVHGVVHVKNVAVFGETRSPWGQVNSGGKTLRGAGSGVIISPDGYIVTNNHVIDKANEIEVTLNNNQTFKAKLIGTDSRADIALLKIEAKDLEYLPFGNSNNVRIGEWVLAVGNPFNLTSTVTAGIVSAKARDLATTDMTPQSFLQTDAAINPGNSGGALVNINGELVGINTAITSQTGSYVGYGFAVPSNNVRKIVEDIMEFGNVQQGILGIRGQDVNPAISRELDLSVSQGVVVSTVDSESGAALAGIKAKDVIRRIDNIEVRKMSDLTGYIGSKRPGDIVNVQILRDGRERDLAVEISKYETYAIIPIGLEVANASKEDLERFKAKNGVRISRALKGDRQSNALVGIIITKIDDRNVSDVNDVKRILNSKDPEEPISVTFMTPEGKEQTYIWR
ncbi:MAG TPA: trypsin-like peptidase domain-containing protein [Gillisia sp.]|nr:trypsin-like peptidase domain-containing protein [Gillisia sp.]